MAIDLYTALRQHDKQIYQDCVRQWYRNSPGWNMDNPSQKAYRLKNWLSYYEDSKNPEQFDATYKWGKSNWGEWDPNGTNESP